MSDTHPISEDKPDPDVSTEVTEQPAKAPIAELSPAACAAKLAELFPALFSVGAPKPLKLRIQADIQARSPGVFTRKSLSNFLHRHTTSTAYLRVLANSPSRIDLDGEPAGDLSDEHRQAAVTELERRRTAHETRRAAEREAQRAGQREAQQQALREFTAQADERRERAGLLRAFESTTLTLANFCALKSIPQDELEATLALARQDREQAAKAAPPPQPRAARPEGRDNDRRPRPDQQRPGQQRQQPRRPAAAKTGS